MNKETRAAGIGAGIAFFPVMIVLVLIISIWNPKNFNLFAAFMASIGASFLGGVIGVLTFQDSRRREAPAARTLALTPGKQPLEMLREYAGEDIRSQLGSGAAFKVHTQAATISEVTELFKETRMLADSLEGYYYDGSENSLLPDPINIIPDPQPSYYEAEPEPEPEPEPMPEPPPKVTMGFYGQEEEGIDLWNPPQPQPKQRANVKAWE